MTTTTPIPGAGQTDERALFEAAAIALGIPTNSVLALKLFQAGRAALAAAGAPADLTKHVPLTYSNSAQIVGAGAPVQQSEPQPISTAPHDGTEVLAWSITGKTWHQVYWKTQENGDWAWVKSFFPRWACRWNEAYSQGQNDFSYWLPIPAAPQAPDHTGDAK